MSQKALSFPATARLKNSLAVEIAHERHTSALFSNRQGKSATPLQKSLDRSVLANTFATTAILQSGFAAKRPILYDQLAHLYPEETEVDHSSSLQNGTGRMFP
ncbi:MAG: hypothetical protein ABJU19_00580 [Roseobacter sp.]